MDISNTLVICMGMGTVFVGLISLIFICYIVGFFCKLFAKNETVVAKTSVPAAPSVTAAPIQNKQEILAAACAVIAEELGTEANNIKVVSFKRV